MKQGITTVVVLTFASAGVVAFMTWFVVACFVISAAVYSAEKDSKLAKREAVTIRLRLRGESESHQKAEHVPNERPRHLGSSALLSYWEAN